MKIISSTTTAKLQSQWNDTLLKSAKKSTDSKAQITIFESLAEEVEGSGESC